MVRVLSLAVLLCASGCATAAPRLAPSPQEEAAILAVVDRFMDAVSTNDAALLSEIRLDGGFNIVERASATGGTTITRRIFKPAETKPGAYRERYWDPIVHVRGSLAVVWTPYEFWIDGKTSHCGVDVFDMVREKGIWRIANAMWTVERDACPALRPADPSRLRPAR
jgi:hypothetical protein